MPDDELRRLRSMDRVEQRRIRRMVARGEVAESADEARLAAAVARRELRTQRFVLVLIVVVLALDVVQLIVGGRSRAVSLISLVVFVALFLGRVLRWNPRLERAARENERMAEGDPTPSDD